MRAPLSLHSIQFGACRTACALRWCSFTEAARGSREAIPDWQGKAGQNLQLNGHEGIGYATTAGMRAGCGKFSVRFVTIFAQSTQDLHQKGVVAVQNLGFQCNFRCEIPVSGTMPVILSEQNLEMAFSSCWEVFFSPTESGVPPAGPPQPVGPIAALSASRASPPQSAHGIENPRSLSPFSPSSRDRACAFPGQILSQE